MNTNNSAHCGKKRENVLYACACNMHNAIGLSVRKDLRNLNA